MEKILKKIFNKIFRKSNKTIKPLITIPEQNIIRCEIETPQFHGSQKKFTMYRQTGKFYKLDMKFLHDGSLFYSHDVQFNNIEEFQKALIRLL